MITGLPGHGKGVYSLWSINKKAKEENRQVYYHNINNLSLDWVELDNPHEWYKLPEGAIIVFDEAWKQFPARPTGAKVPQYIEEFATHRHRGYDIFIITQHPGQIDSFVRKMTDEHFHIVRKFGMHRAVVHKFFGVNDQPGKSRNGSIKTDFTYPKEVFGWYKSAEIHTVKRRVPWPYIAKYVLPVLAVAMFYGGWQYLKAFTQHTDPKAAANEAAGGDYRNPISSAEKKPDWYESQKPRIPDLPFTAPKYDEITKPVMAPRVAAAVIIRGHCTAYTQQATRITMDEALCRQFVETGFFQDFDDGSSKFIADQKNLEQRTNSPNALSDAQRPQGESVAPAAVAVIPHPEESERIPTNRVRESQSQNRFPNMPQPYAEGS